MKARILVALLALGAFGACKTTTEHASPAARADAGEGQPTANASRPEAGILEQGRELTRQFYERELDALWERMTAQMIEAMGRKEELAKFRGHVGEQFGDETQVLDEKVISHAPFQVYVRWASYSKIGVPVVVQWTLDSEGKIAGFFVRPAQ